MKILLKICQKFYSKFAKMFFQNLPKILLKICQKFYSKFGKNFTQDLPKILLKICQKFYSKFDKILIILTLELPSLFGDLIGAEGNWTLQKVG